MSENRLLTLLGEDRIAVCDGAMGTMLYARGVFVNRSFDELNLSHPDMVRAVHAEYVAAGADVIETNTFSANRFKLAPHGCVDQLRAINEAGVRLAREAAGEGTLVAGSIGPLGVRIEPWGPVSKEEAAAAFREQAEALLAGEGVDLFILETFYHLPELQQVVLALRGLSDKPIVAQLTVTEEGSTPEGLPPSSFARTIQGWDVDAVGINCGVGPIPTLEVIEELREATDLPLSAQPNAGSPRNVHGRNMYLTSPEYLASYARRFVKSGARLVGGCCGTTPEHVKAIKEAVANARPAPRRARIRTSERVRPRAVTVPREEKSQLARRLSGKSFPICVQARPPRGSDVAGIIRRVRALGEGSLDLIFVPELRGGARMAPFAMAQLCQRDGGAEALVELACRQRTLLRLQAEVLGAYALGLRNLVLVTGPPPALGQPPDATAHLEVDSIGLTNMVRRLNEGLDIGGRSLGRPTGLHIGVHLDPLTPDVDHEIRRFEWKVDAGAEFALTPPVLDVAAFAAFLERVAHCRIPIVASVPILSGYRDAEFLRREAGAGRPLQEDLDRLLDAEQDGRAREVGLEIAIRIAEELRPFVDGLQVVCPEGHHLDALELVAALKATVS